MDHDYHHPKTDYKLMSKQDLIDHIEQLEAKVATLSKENELYKKKDKETIWVSMNSMKKKEEEAEMCLQPIEKNKKAAREAAQVVSDVRQQQGRRRR